MTERRTTIRQKLLAAMLLPVLFVALVSGAQVVRAVGERSDVRAQADLGRATGGPTALVDTLLNERNIIGLEMLGSASLVKLPGIENSDDARKLVDQAFAEFERYLDRSGDQVQGIYRKPFEEATDAVKQVRADFDAYKASGGSMASVLGRPSDAALEAQVSSAMKIYDVYTKVAQSFIAANNVAISQIDDAVLRNRAARVSNVTVSTEALSRMARTVAITIITQGVATPGQNTEVAQLFDRYKQARTSIYEGMDDDPGRVKVAVGYFERKSFQPFDGMIEAFLEKKSMIADDDDASRVGVAEVLAVMQVASGTKLVDGEAVLEQPSAAKAGEALNQSLGARADQLAGAANRTLWISVAVFVVTAGLSLALAFFVARSISRPVISLAAQAREMSERSLPDAVGEILASPAGHAVPEPRLDPVTVTSTDELADVAAALTQVQQRALGLAGEQAAQRNNFTDAFVNLGKRMQGLMTRQLDFITELEDAETDETALANLFHIDHMATRVRRNAESLIVLGGVDQRSLSKLEPLEAVDAVRAALSEVEYYQRVSIGTVDDAVLPGDVAADVSHIISELLENGLTFSPADSAVEVTGTLREGGFVYQITDTGIGMSEEELATANRRLSGQDRFAQQPSRHLGLFIAGHLATRLGATVRVRSGSSGGTVAEVALGSSLLVTR